MPQAEHDDPEYLRELLRHWLFSYGIIAPDGEIPERDDEAMSDITLDTLRTLAPIQPDCAHALANLEANRNRLLSAPPQIGTTRHDV